MATSFQGIRINASMTSRKLWQVALSVKLASITLIQSKNYWTRISKIKWKRKKLVKNAFSYQRIQLHPMHLQKMDFLSKNRRKINSWWTKTRLVVWSSSSWLSARSACWSSSSTSRNVRMQWHRGWPEERSGGKPEIVNWNNIHLTVSQVTAVSCLPVKISKCSQSHKAWTEISHGYNLHQYITRSRHGNGIFGNWWIYTNLNKKQIPVLVLTANKNNIRNTFCPNQCEVRFLICSKKTFLVSKSE